MEKRILLPTDFSENALNAIEYALHLYEHKTCVFYILNAFQYEGYTVNDTMMQGEPRDPDYEAMKKVSVEGLNELMKLLGKRKKNPKHSYQTLSIYNSLPYAVEDTIAKNDIDMVIMGAQGFTAAEAFFYGSNTMDVMEYIMEAPVMAIPSDFKFSRPKEIVLPTKYKVVFKRKELDPMLEIARMHKSMICILHIEKEEELNKKQEDNKALLESILKDLKHSYHTLTDVKVHKGISSFIERGKSDMIVFMDKKTHLFGNKLSKPLAKEIETHAIIPVMAITIK